jgi:hypothetical protein
MAGLKSLIILLRKINFISREIRDHRANSILTFDLSYFFIIFIFLHVACQLMLQVE